METPDYMHPLYSQSGCLDDPDSENFRCHDCGEKTTPGNESEEYGTCKTCFAINNIMEKMRPRYNRPIDDFVANVMIPIYEATDFDSMKIKRL